VLLDPPGWRAGWSQGLPHWPYVPYIQAVDQALTDRGIPPGIARADVALRAYCQRDRHDTIHMTLAWDVSRTGARSGVRLTWEEETGWFSLRYPGRRRRCGRGARASLAHARGGVRSGVGPGARGAQACEAFRRHRACSPSPESPACGAWPRTGVI
jgi:hypothetical protein